MVVLRARDWLAGDRRFPGEVRFPGVACVVRIESRIETMRDPAREPLLHRVTHAHGDGGGRRGAGALGDRERLHWVLDVTFEDDQSRLRKGHGAETWPSSATSPSTSSAKPTTGAASRHEKARRLGPITSN